MPYSKKQKVAAAIALHNPSKLHAENRGMLSMSKDEMHKMASGKVLRGLRKTKKDDIDR